MLYIKHMVCSRGIRIVRRELESLELRVLATPGHTSDSLSFLLPDAVLTGDTLFEGGPGATRWGYSSFERIISSIEDRLFPLPDEFAVHTGHGPSTTIGTERPALPDWIARGW